VILADAEVSPMKVVELRKWFAKRRGEALGLKLYFLDSVTKNKDNHISFNLRFEDSGDQRKNEEAILEAETFCEILAEAKEYA
jgi:hypothetical protein